jgi:hypothetical protein
MTPPIGISRLNLKGTRMQTSRRSKILPIIQIVTDLPGSDVRATEKKADTSPPPGFNPDHIAGRGTPNR